jgi:hypothetical protein
MDKIPLPPARFPIFVPYSELNENETVFPGNGTGHGTGYGWRVFRPFKQYPVFSRDIPYASRFQISRDKPSEVQPKPPSQALQPNIEHV